MACLGSYQIHFAYVTLVLLVGGNFLRIRRPQKDWMVALRPSRVVERIGVIRHSIWGKLFLFAGSLVTNPQIVIAKKCRLGLVGRQHTIGNFMMLLFCL